MKTIRIALIGLCFLNSPHSVQGDELDNTFFCFHNGVTSLRNCPPTLEAKAALVKRLGFDGLGGHHGTDYFQLRQAMDQVALPMPEIYVSMTLNKNNEATCADGLKKILNDCRNRDLLVSLCLPDKKWVDRHAQGDPVYAAGIRELADYCAPLDIQIAIYPHANFYCETVDHAVQLAERVGRKNVGTIFNLCHFLKVESDRDWREALDRAFPHLMMVSIHGADAGATQTMGWDRLIQPLGEGTYDTYALVKYLKDRGYRGKFGLQCYNIQQDCETALTQSIRTWRDFQQRYRDETGSETGSEKSPGAAAWICPLGPVRK